MLTHVYQFNCFSDCKFVFVILFHSEFPAVLLNLQTRVIEADFHTFVKPTEIPELSEFCTNYTGITQNDVDNGVHLSEAIQKFHQWIRSFRYTKDLVLIDDSIRKQNTVLITWTDFDLGIYIRSECERKHIKLPAYFNKWIDLRDYYSVSIEFFSFFIFLFLSQLQCFLCFSKSNNLFLKILIFLCFLSIYSYGLALIESYHFRLHWKWLASHSLDDHIRALMIRET